MGLPLSLASAWSNDQPKNTWTIINSFCAMPSVKKLDGASGTSSLPYSVVENLSVICMLSVPCHDGISKGSAVKQFNIPLSNFEKWMKEDIFTQLAECPRKCTKSSHHGPDHQHNLIFKDAILHFIFKNHEQWISISILSMVIHVGSLSQELEMKPWLEKRRAVARFLKSGDMLTIWAC